MTDLKNYSKCPLKKRPVMMVDDDDDDHCEPEQDEPVNLCIKRVKCEADEVPQNLTVDKTYPLKDITQTHQQTASAFSSYAHHEPTVIVTRNDRRKPDTYRPLYDLLPGYYMENETSNYDALPVKDDVYEPQYSREYSVSPPASTNYVSIKPEYELDYPPNKLNYKSESYSSMPSTRYAAYPPTRHLMANDYHHMPPVPSPISLNSLGSPRSSLSPASTGSLAEDMYHTVTKQSQFVYDMVDHSVPYCSDEKSADKPQRYQCTECGKSYSTFSGLTKHRQFHCPAAEGNQKKSFSCKYCDKTYTSLGALKMHIRTHTLPCKCTICGKAFSRPWLLQGHIRTHTGEKPFSCQYCHRAFADRSNLRAHLQTHSDVKKYSCATCNKTFSRMSLLTKHREGGCSGEIHSSVPGSYMDHIL